jgi:maltooligosyltrehalose synthase
VHGIDFAAQILNDVDRLLGSTGTDFLDRLGSVFSEHEKNSHLSTSFQQGVGIEMKRELGRQVKNPSSSLVLKYIPESRDGNSR